jgi:hypothetical protein
MTTTAWLAIVVLAIAALLGGEWLGEGLEAPLGRIGVLAILIVAAAICAALCARPGWLRRLVAGVCISAAACLGFWFGDRVATRAFNSCVERGEEVRAALAEHKSRTGRYPASLHELGSAMPGARVLRGNILVYQPHPDGYALSFSDWLVTHSATERGEWRVAK